MDVEQFKEDVRGGRISADRLVEVVVTSQRELQAAKQELDQAKRRIAELERQLGGPPTAKVSQPFSLRAEEQRQEARGKKRRKRKRRSRGGRTTTAEKVARTVRSEKVLPTGVPEADCWLSHTRPVWRLENGQLFTFVTAAPVEKPNGEMLVVPGTNNESERTLRPAAAARGTGRSNKSVPGARRQTVIVSVLESLRQYLSTFTLSSVIEEIRHWSKAGRSCFARLAEKLGLTEGRLHAHRPSLLDRLLPVPDG
jgi:hypothetical protein